MHLYNSFGDATVTFEDRKNPVRIYVCGITPYASSHLGHAFTYAAGDVLVRYLQYRGFTTRYVQNVTDIDDPIIRESKKQNMDWRELGRQCTVRFIDEMKTLNILPPDFFPKATEVIDSILETVAKLVDAGAAYESGGSVFYSVKGCRDFGRRSGTPKERRLEIANDRGNHPDDSRKRDPLDFPLWQAQEEGEPSWDSPWGPGRPGWHIECSTMANRYLNGRVDIHGGGSDLAFPHHEAEIAQFESAEGKSPFARCWFHTAMVHHEGEKMSKSVGNLVMVKDLLRKYSADGIRLYLASQHYREPWPHNPAHLAASEALAQKLRTAVENNPEEFKSGSSEPGQYREAFEDAMDDDLDTPRAIELFSDIADAGLHSPVPGLTTLLLELSSVLGIRLGKDPESDRLQGWDRHRARFDSNG